MKTGAQHWRASAQVERRPYGLGKPTTLPPLPARQAHDTAAPHSKRLQTYSTVQEPPLRAPGRRPRRVASCVTSSSLKCSRNSRRMLATCVQPASRSF
jgi:hypothetical protein